MSTVQRIAKNIIVLIVADIIGKIFGLTLVIFIARYLGATGFGKYSFAFAFISLFAIFTDLGLNTLTIREVSRDKSKAGKYLGNILIIKLFLVVIFFILIFVVIKILNYPKDTTLAVYIIGLSVILNSFAQTFRSIFRAYEKMEYEALLNILNVIITTSLGISVLYLNYGLIELVSIFFIVSLLNLVLSSFLIIKKFIKPEIEMDFNFWRKILRNALPFAITGIFVIIYFKIDIVMLSVIEGDDAVGWYSAAYKMIESLLFIPSVFMISLYPVLSHLYTSSHKNLKKSYYRGFKYLFILGLPIAIGTTILAKEFIYLIYTQNFVNSIDVLKILIWACLFIFLSHITSTVLISINRQNINMYLASIMVVLNISLNLLLIPKYGLLGASISTLITEGMVMIFGFYFVSKFLVFLPLQNIIVKPIISALLMGIFIYNFKYLNLFCLILLATIFYFGLLILFRTFTKEDIQIFKSVFSLFQAIILERLS